jgi:hypothetical protein
MGIEVLLRSSEAPTRTVQVAKATASDLALALASERGHDDSVRLIFEEPAGKQFIVTIQSDGEIHAESFGPPRTTGEADLAVIRALLPDAKVVGSNPSWDSEAETGYNGDAVRVRRDVSARRARG